MSNKLIKSVYYTRVSTNKEEQEQSFEAQEIILTGITNGWKHNTIYSTKINKK